MRSPKLFLPLLLIATPALAQSTPAATAPAKSVSIPFVNHGGIYNYEADGDHGLYIQDVHRAWYYASLFSPCFDLPYANAVGFHTRGIDTLDKFGAIVVGHQECQINDLVASGPPPRKEKKAKG